MAQSLVKDSTIYGLGSLLSRAVGLLLIPVYTRYLTTADYGALALLNLIVQNVSFICLLGVSTAAMRYYFEPGASEPERATTYGNATALLIVFPPVVLALLAPATWFIVSHWLPSVPFFPFVLVALLTGLFTPITKLLLGLLRVRRQAGWFIAFNIGLLLLQAVAILVALAGLGMGLAGQLYAQLVAYAVFAAVAIWLLTRYARPQLDRANAFRLLAYGLPLVPFFIFSWIFEAAGRFMLEHFADLGRVGIFALAAQFAGLIAMAGSALDNVMLPHFLDNAGKAEGGARLGALIHKYLTWLGLLGLTIMVGASPAIRFFAGEAYVEAERHVAPLVLAFWLSMARTPITWSLNYSKRSGTLSLLNGGGVVALTLMLYLALGRWQLGIDGVALATVAANLLVIGAGYGLAQRSYQLRVPRARFALTVLTLVGAGVLIGWLGPAAGNWRLLGAEVAVLAAAGLLAMRLAGLSNPLRALFSR